MSKIPPSVEKIVSERFEVLDVTYYPDSVEFILSNISPEDSRERFIEILNKVSSMELTPKLYLEDDRLKLKVSMRKKPITSRKNLVAVLNTLAIGTVFISSWAVASGTGKLLEELGIHSNILSDILISSSAMLVFLLVHGLAHTIERWNERKSWLSLFIPAPPPPLGFGTLGDILVIDEPLVNREEMLDLGLSGLLAGLMISIMISFLGLLQSPAVPSKVAESWVKEGKAGYLPTPLIFFLMERVLSPGGDKVLLLSPLALTGMSALLITFLISMPLMPWDGGYIAHSLIPTDKIRKIDWLAVIGVILINPLLGALMLLSMFMTFKSISLDEYSEVSPSKKKRGFVAYILILFFSIPIIQ